MRYLTTEKKPIHGRSMWQVTLAALAFISLFIERSGKIYAAPVKRITGTVISPRSMDALKAHTMVQDTVKPVVADMTTKVSKEEFKQKALSRIKEFQNCLVILCDKKAGNEAQDNAVDQATSLFIDGAIIEVSTVHSDEKKHLKVRDFLEKLRSLRYERVVITFSHVEYISNVRKGADGKYYGVVSFEQTFRAFSDGRLVYEDETKKTTEVQLVVYERNLRGNVVQQWDVLLSDVEVLGTKTPKQ